MKINVGSIDRVIRVVLGLGILSLLYFLEGNIRWFGLIGLVLLFTGLFSFCPVYALFGFSTGPRQEKPR